MNILILAATSAEVQPLCTALGVAQPTEEETITVSHRTHTIMIAISGVGMTAMAFCCGKFFSAAFDLVINVGIAGAFDRTLPIGSVVQVTEDIFSELGAEDGEQWRTLQEIGLATPTVFHATKKISDLPAVRGITVNTIHGHEPSIERVIARFHPQVESMEGAAFLYACDRAKIPGLQIRAISNYVERRNKSAWDIPLAVKNLGEVVMTIIQSLKCP